MIRATDIQNLIAKDKKELTPFILNLCGFTLDQANYNSKNYAFYLHVAFRHQVIRQSETWDEICKDVNLAQEQGNPLSWRPEHELLRNRIATFAQSIVTEVVEASQDNWSIKLLKTSYLATLDRARKSSENASRRIYVEKGQKIEDIHLSVIESQDKKLPKEETTQAFLDVLSAQRAYLDSLLALPFNMEKMCLRIAESKKANYQPRKTAEMLAKTLDTINLVLSTKGETTTRNDVLIGGLKFALELTMPDFKFADHDLVDFISEELLPFINQLIINSQNLEAVKDLLLPKDNQEIAEARKQILASMDVHFYSVHDILQETLIKPVEQCNHAVAGARGMGVAAYNIVQENNEIDRAFQFAALFKNFDKVATACSKLDPALLPSWLFQANGYYQQLKNGVSMVNAVAQIALNGLGAFYNCPGFYNQLAFYIPQSIRYYISQTDSLTKIFNQIDNTVYKVPTDKVLAYFAFFELIEEGKITDPVLKANLFEVYMAEVVKADNKLLWEEFKFENYLKLETQLKNKFNLKLSLAKRMVVYAEGSEKFSTDSLILASKAQGITNPWILHLLVLINRLQTVESNFDIKNPQSSFIELALAAKEGLVSPKKEIQAFYQEFLLPAMQRMNSQYQNERLIPLIEARLESTDNYSHKLREVYSKLREEIKLPGDDVIFLKEYFSDNNLDFNIEQFDFIEELTSYHHLVKSLPEGKRLQNPDWETPKEIRNQTAAKTLKNARRIINPLLNELQKTLDEQNKRLKEIKDIDLAEKKIKYIEALNGLINKLRREINTPQSDLQKYIIKLLNGEVRELTLQQLINHMSLDAISAIPGQLISSTWNALPTIPGKLMSFAWNVLPAIPENNLFYNLLEYYLRDIDSLHQVVVAEKNYTDCMNSNPIPALMNDLNDPLATANILPSQEKMMDAILANLIETSKQQAFSWGVNYLKEFVVNISYQQLIRFLPYPFLAELALMAINSEALQAHVAPVFNSLMNEYGGMVGDELKKAAKKRLYPILGIEIQKTVESCAYGYVLTPEKTNETNRDAFAMYYLQYCEIRQSSPSFNSEAAIRFLFPNLLADADNLEQARILANIDQAFLNLDKLIAYYELPKRNAIDESNQQLQFLIEHIDFTEPANDKLIKLALVNRLLIMNLDSADQIKDEDKISKLQIQAINRLSDTIDRINHLADQAVSINISLGHSAVLPPLADEACPEAMTKVIAGAQKRASEQQFKRVKSYSERAKELVKKELIQLEAMKGSKEPLLGISLLEWNYRKSTLARKIFLGVSHIAAVLGPILTWISIIGAASEGLLAGLGIAVGLGASVTGIGLAVFAAGALFCLGWNFSLNIFNELLKLKSISDEKTSFLDRAERISLIVAKCFGMALLKTLLIDYLMNILKNLFAAEPIADLVDAVSFWPTEERVSDEIEGFKLLQSRLLRLESLVDKQINFITNNINPTTQESYSDQSDEIAKAIDELTNTIEVVEKFILSVSPDDARFVEKDYLTLLVSFEDSFTELKAEITRLQTLQAVQTRLVIDKSAEAKVDHLTDRLVASMVLQNTDQDKPVIVNIDDYKAKFQKQSGLFSNIYNWFKPKPTLVAANTTLSELSTNSLNVSKETNDSPKKDLPVTGVNPLAMSGETLVDSILEGISASEVAPVKPSFFNWFPRRSKPVVDEVRTIISPGLTGTSQI
jgi:hypothetical protein